MIINQKQRSAALTTIVWFRRDFRLANNPALNFALNQGGRVVAMYLENEVSECSWTKGAASRWWCHHSLMALSDRLAEKGIRLTFFRGNPAKLIPQIIQETKASSISWNRLYEPAELKLDQTIEQQLSNVEIRKFDSNLLFPPGTILNQQDQAYRVFTPFWKKVRIKLELEGVNPVPLKKCNRITGYEKNLSIECHLDELELLDETNWHIKLNQYWTPGEKEALRKVRKFLNKKIVSYETQREFPSVEGTSKLSPHLHFGEITPTQIISSLLKQDWLGSYLSSVERFITEIGWREFSHHILWHFPHTTSCAMNDRFKKFWPAKPNKKLLRAWQTGNTGVAMVDAGMRELWETGWMHNRVRMIVASFLTKNLGIHWLHGAKWFWDTLVDAELANNTLGWQWVAGCGVDAAPYYRIFNPYTQAKKFDSKLVYINEWVSEYAETGGIPIVNIQKSRVEALSKYKRFSENSIN